MKLLFEHPGTKRGIETVPGVFTLPSTRAGFDILAYHCRLEFSNFSGIPFLERSV